MKRCFDCKHGKRILVQPSDFLFGLDAMYPYHVVECRKDPPRAGFFGGASWPRVEPSDSCSSFTACEEQP